MTLDAPMVSALAAVIVSVGSLLLGIWSRRKTNAEAGAQEASGVKTVSDAAIALVKPLEERIDKLERMLLAEQTRSASLRDETITLRAENLFLTQANHTLEARVSQLEAQLASMSAPAAGPCT